MNENGIPIEVKAWAAGFWEGEGSVHITRRRKLGKRNQRLVSHKLRVTCTNTKLEPLFLFKERWGGYTHKRKPKLGRNHIGATHWIVGNKLAEQFLSDILPYLVFKKEQAEIGLRLRSLMKPVGNYGELLESDLELRDYLRDSLMRLNRRGVK